MLDDPRVNLMQFSDGLFPSDDAALATDIDAELSRADLQSLPALETFIRQHLYTGLARTEAVIVCLGVRLGASGDLAAALVLDGEADAMFHTPIARETSRRRGRTTLQLATRLTESTLLLGLSVRAEAGTTPCHHALVFGLVAGVLGWSARVAVEAYLQGAAHMIVSAARRRHAFAPMEGQRVVWSLERDIVQIAQKAAAAEALAIWSYTLSGDTMLAH